MCKLVKYKRQNKLTWDEFAKKIGITRQNLTHIIRKRSPKIGIKTAMKIEALTGLGAHEYLDGLNTLEKIIAKNKKEGGFSIKKIN